MKKITVNKVNDLFRTYAYSILVNIKHKNSIKRQQTSCTADIVDFIKDFHLAYGFFSLPTQLFFSKKVKQ